MGWGSSRSKCSSLRLQLQIINVRVFQGRQEALAMDAKADLLQF